MLNIFCIISIFSLNLVNSRNISALPPIFHLDDYTNCRRNQQHYCHINIELSPLSEDNVTEIWSTIEFTKNSYRHYDHSRLRYGICVENHCRFVQDTQELTGILDNYYSDKFKEIGLKARITEIDCNNYDNIYTTSLYDWIVLYSLISYFLLLIGASFYHYINLKKSTTMNKYLLPFSLINNYRKLKISADSSKIKYIQGFRFYSTIFIVYAHTLASFLIAYVKDTDFIEDYSNSIIKCIMGFFFMYLVQSYFLLSGWFLSYNSLDTFRKSPKLSMTRFITLTLINRYLRIGVPLGICMALASSSWIYQKFYGPVKHMIADVEYVNCKAYWWMNMLFINNQYAKPICYIVSWYLSADTQIYILSLFLLVAIRMHQRWIKRILAVPVVITILAQILIAYRLNLDSIYKLVPKKYKVSLVQTPEFYFLYIATYLNIPSYIIGIGFGYLHYQYGEKLEFYKNNIFLSKWWFAFITLPALSAILPMFKYDRLTTSILSAILKPMYALGLAIGAFGMSYEKDGLIKRLLEWKPAVFLGSVTFSTYLSHFIFVFYRPILATTPLRISNWILLKAGIQDVILAFIIGICVHLTIELPTVQLQKLLLPKVKND